MKVFIFSRSCSIALLAMLPFLQLVFQSDASAVEPTKPNVIMVFIDDMGWEDFSCFGNQDASTPNVDRMAAEGLRFSQFYVNSPICSPSRCALTTGQYPQRWRITSFLNNRADNERRGVAQWLDPKAPTLARFLHQAGYATGHFGKWHLGGQRDVDEAPSISAYGFDQSLTNFEGMGPKLLPLTLKPGDDEPGKIWQDAERLGGPATWMLRSKITSGFIDAAIPFMKRAMDEGKPFYVNLWPDDVHGPYWPPVDKWADGKRGKYLSVLEEMDRQFGRLFEFVRQNPELKENTLVLICSDNGHEPGAGRGGVFRGAKTRIYEGGIRSPLVVWSPGLMDSAAIGTLNDTSIFSAIDLVPTIMAIADVEVPEGVEFDGERLDDVVLGRTKNSRKQPLFWRRPPDRKTWDRHIEEPQPDLAMREGKWKLLCDYDGSNAELYDLETNPGESNNLANENADVANAMKRQLLQWHQSMPADRGPELGLESAQ